MEINMGKKPNMIIKRDGSKVLFDPKKIELAITKALISEGVASIFTGTAHAIAESFESENETPTIKEIEEYVFKSLCEAGLPLVAKAYEGYRSIREFQRSDQFTDESILSIVAGGTDEDLRDENSNKNVATASTQRDMIAGEASKDIAMRHMLPPHVVQAHKDGLIHFHDLDYAVQRIFNCCLVDLRGPFKDGTVINKKMIETPKSFRTACTVATQIVQQVACGQYGGQTISLAHLAPYVRVSYEKIKNQVREELFGDDVPLASPTKLCGNREVEHIAKKRLRKEIEDGLQTIQYQVNTFSTSNGQAPFLSIFMYLNEDPEYIEETAMLIEEMIKQRYIGMKNEAGVYVTPAFPKLLYVLDENNVPKDSKYRYLTDLAVKCVARRMMPDFISAKKMKENYEDVFPCMGCRSFLSQYRDKDGKLKWYNRFNQGVVTLNLADAGLSAGGNIDAFWKILDERLELVHDGLMCKHKSLLGTKAEKSPIHWQHGVIARLKKDDVIDPYLKDGYSTLSLGYIGLHECVLALIGESHTTERGEELAVRIMRRLRKACDDWRAESGLGFSLYGSPSESTTYRLAQTTQKRFGVVKGITDRDYLTNSYHVDVTEKISAFDKLRFESQFQKISSGGCISYVEVPNLEQNLEVIDQLVSYMYETIQYAEINTKSDYCAKCGFRGEIKLNNNLDWECPQCHTVNRDDLTVCRRTCGYLGDNFWNKGRTEEIGARVLHVDNEDLS
nr:MAG TPA: anaerobic ribonucleoside triphosphate reductase [Siphoviridae sp. ctFjF5]DAU57342.1 MAG TPA: anaerobic ribonucleoside triphosphate reductase [Caudoviricetes sp.]